MASDPLRSLREQVEEIVGDGGMDPSDRSVKLLHLREGVEALLGLIATHLGDADLAREAEASGAVRARLRARQNASIREALVARGEATAAELDAMGYLAHDELDRLDEEGLLEVRLREVEVEKGLVLREAPMAVEDLLDQLRGPAWELALRELEEAHGYRRSGEPAAGEALLLERGDPAAVDRIVVTFAEGEARPEEVAWTARPG